MRNVADIAYHKYKLDWMRTHGFTLDDLMDAITEYGEDSGEPLTTLFAGWQDDVGFGGECWVCFDEFLEYEYQNKEYMKRLLSDVEFEQYLKEVMK